jgi:flagellar hook-associated protein 1 FlgK
VRELFEIGKSGLLSSNKALNVVSHNIANAGTEGYSRQRVDLAPVDFKRGGFSNGIGVSVEQITRLRNDILDTQIQQQETNLGSLNERLFVFSQLESVFSAQAGADLDKMIYNFFDAFNELASQPENRSYRDNIVQLAQNMVAKFKSITSSLDSVKTTVVDGARGQTGEINKLLSEIASLNLNITRGNAQGKPDNFSLDMQTKKLTDLSRLVDFSTARSELGSLELRIGGVVVVRDDRADTISPEIDLGNNVFRLRLSNGVALDRVGGTLGERIDLFKNDLPAIQAQIDAIAKEMASKVNEVHRTGYGLTNSTGINFFNPDSTSASNMSINASILSDPRLIAASGSANAPGNNQIAIKLANLTNADVFNGRSFGQQALFIASSIGTELSQTRTSIETADATKRLLTNQQEAIAGVNVDEELANMIKFQNAYQASARVLTAATEMMNTLLTMGA